MRYEIISYPSISSSLSFMPGGSYRENQRHLFYYFQYREASKIGILIKSLLPKGWVGEPTEGDLIEKIIQNL